MGHTLVLMSQNSKSVNERNVNVVSNKGHTLGELGQRPNSAGFAT